MINYEVCNDDISFDNFVINNKYSHYQKTSAWGKYRVSCCGDLDNIKVVAKQDNNIVATGLILITKRKGIGKVAYIPWGFCLDYDNHELLDGMVKYVLQVIKSYDCTCLKIDFNVKRLCHDIKGNIIDGENNETLTNHLIDIGFKHKGYGYAYNGSWVNRFTLIANISKDKYEKTIQKSLYSSSKRQLNNGVIVKDGTKDDIDTFLKFEQQLADKKSFISENRQYFVNILDNLKPYVIFKIAYIDYQARLDNFKKELNSKGIDKDIEHKERLIKDVKQLEDIVASGKTKDAIGGAIYLQIGNKLFNWYLYTDKNFNQYIPAGVLHLSMIRQAVAGGVDYMDFVGFAGNCDHNDPYYGLYEFKSKWGSEFVEYIGEFDYVLKPLQYNSDKFARKVKHIIKKL